MKHTWFLIACFACLLVANVGCNKCEGIDCFTPPNILIFQLLDKETGEDLIANGTYLPEEVVVYAVYDDDTHDLSHSYNGSNNYFSDFEIGTKTGPKRSSYELRLGDDVVIPFTYEVSKRTEDCCTFFELEQFEINGVERLYIPQQNLFQLRL